MGIIFENENYVWEEPVEIKDADFKELKVFIKKTFLNIRWLIIVIFVVLLGLFLDFFTPINIKWTQIAFIPLIFIIPFFLSFYLPARISKRNVTIRESYITAMYGMDGTRINFKDVTNVRIGPHPKFPHIPAMIFEVNARREVAFGLSGQALEDMQKITGLLQEQGIFIAETKP